MQRALKIPKKLHRAFFTFLGFHRPADDLATPHVHDQVRVQVDARYAGFQIRDVPAEQEPIQAGGNWYAYVNQDPVNWVDPLGFTASDLKNAGNGPKVVLSNGMSLYVPPPEPQTPLFTVTRKQWDLAGQLSNPNYVLESSPAVLGDLSFGLNAAAIASSFVYPAAAAVFASASIVADSLSTALYTASALNGGDKIAAALSVGSLALDAFIPTSVGFSLSAGSTGRFRSLATGKFVTKAAGRAATAKGPTLGALYNVGSNAAEGANK